MADGPMAPGGGRSDEADPLEPLDPDLTIFALANGMDLARVPGGRASRTLSWFREGLERSIRIETATDGAASVRVAARAGRRDESGEAGRELRRPLSVDELTAGLRPLLSEALEAANALSPADLS